MHDFSGMADAGGMGYPPSPLIGPWPRVFGCEAGVYTPNLNPEERSRFGHPSREGEAFINAERAAPADFCAFDARNREHHARNAGRLF